MSITVSSAAAQSLRAFCVAFIGGGLHVAANLTPDSFRLALQSIAVAMFISGLVVSVVRGIPCIREKLILWWVIPAAITLLLLVSSLLLAHIAML